MEKVWNGMLKGSRMDTKNNISYINLSTKKEKLDSTI